LSFRLVPRIPEATVRENPNQVQATSVAANLHSVGIKLKNDK
jgi:hypothetical protein